MALLHARGRPAVGEAFRGLSIIDTAFDCRIAEVLDVDGRPGIGPVIAGRACVKGSAQLMLDPSDPLAGGYRLSDTWPMG